MGLSLRVRGLLGGIAVVVSQLGVVPASYADDATDLSVSLESDHDWVTSIDKALFVPGTPWHPGDSRNEVVYVRNRAKSEADLTVLLDRATTTDQTHGFLSLQVRIAGGNWKEIVISDPSQTLVVPHVPPDGEVAIMLQASLLSSAPADVQPARADLTFEIEVTANSAAPDHGPTSKSGGSNLFLAPLFLIVALLLLLGTRVRRWIIERGHGRSEAAADEPHREDVENEDDGDVSEDDGDHVTADRGGVTT